MKRNSALAERVTNIILASIVLIALHTALYAAESAPASLPSTLRVGLIRYHKGIKTAVFSPSSDFKCICVRTGGVLISGRPGSRLTAAASGSRITLSIDGQKPVSTDSALRIEASSASAVIGVESPQRRSKTYRGSLELSAAAGSLKLVNVVDVEEYLQGVIPAEMPSCYPQEALMAQAVAARTYALNSAGKHRAYGYDVCDSSHCQVYDGVLSEKPACTEAVTRTRGLVLTYNGKPASTMYSADCGGVTQNYSELYPSCDAPYLCRVEDPPDIARCVWEKTYTLQELASKLVKAGVGEASGLTKISVSKVSSSGRALCVDAVGSKGTAHISGDRLRMILGYTSIKSTLFTITCADGNVKVRGKGMGHGVGMCQTGARGLADAPHNYTFSRMLQHYFPGTEIASVSGAGYAKTASVPSTGTSPALRPHQANPAAPPACKPMPPIKDPEPMLFEVRVKPPEAL